MTKPISLPRSKRNFKTQQEAENTIKELRERIAAPLTFRFEKGERDIDMILDKNDQYFPIFVDLLERCDYFKGDSVDEITGIRLSYRKGGRCPYYSLTQYYTLSLGDLEKVPEDQWENFSYVNCIRPASTNKKTIMAKHARSLILEQIEDFKQTLIKEEKYKCIFCGSESDLEIDHIYPFKNLLSDFQRCGANPVTNESGWATFHKNHAKLRCLCSECHFKVTLTSRKEK